MTQVKIERGRLISVVLNHLYPDGNVDMLVERTKMVRTGKEYRLFIELPENHWAFTQEEEPMRYYTRIAKITGGTNVFDREGRTGRIVANCKDHGDAFKIAVLLNQNAILLNESEEER